MSVWVSQMERLDLTDDDEKKLVEQIFKSAVDTLSEDDLKLPQVWSSTSPCLDFWQEL